MGFNRAKITESQMNISEKSNSYISKFKRKIEILNRKIEDYRLTKAHQDQIKYVEILFEEIRGIYTTHLSQCDDEEIEELYHNVLEEYFEELPKLRNSAQKEEKISYRTNLELEKLKIPAFYGEVREWATFHNLFQDMVHDNTQITNAEKMLRLRLSLKGEAARLIQHLQVSSDNYEPAWFLLKQRYDNKRVLFITQWDRLLDQPSINSDNAESVRELLDTTNECLNAIKALEIATQGADPFIARIIVRKLDKDGLKLYEQTIRKCKEVQTLDDILQFLDQHYQTLKSVAEKEPAFKARKHPGNKVHHTFTNKDVAKIRLMCNFCKLHNHSTVNCRRLKDLNSEKRRSFAKERKICYKCLNHKWGEVCENFNTKCKICKKGHHELLHLEEYTKRKSLTTNEKKMTVVLATAQIKAKAYNGEYVLLRALIDQGSQITTISEEAVQMLGVPRFKHKMRIQGLGEAIVGESKHKVNVQVKPRLLGNYEEVVEAVVLPNLTSAQPERSFKYDLDKWNNYLLADPMFNKSDRIDMVIGGDIFSRILEDGIKRCDGIIGQATKFGWILSGLINQAKPKIATSAITNLERFW